MVENADGSVAVELSEVDQMYGTKGRMTFTVYPDRAYIEIRGQLYNRTPLPQTFTQVFMPYKAAGCVKNASAEAVINLEVNSIFWRRMT